MERTSPLAAAGQVGSDALLFTLVDAEGRQSLPAALNLTAVTALSGSPASSSSAPILEETASSITVRQGCGCIYHSLPCSLTSSLAILV